MKTQGKCQSVAKRGNVKLGNDYASRRKNFKGTTQWLCAVPLMIFQSGAQSFLSFTFPRFGPKLFVLPKRTVHKSATGSLDQQYKQSSASSLLVYSYISYTTDFTTIERYLIFRVSRSQQKLAEESRGQQKLIKVNKFST